MMLIQKNFAHNWSHHHPIPILFLITIILLLNNTMLTGGQNLNNNNNNYRKWNSVVKNQQNSYQYRGGQNQNQRHQQQQQPVRGKIQTQTQTQRQRLQTAYKNSYRYQYQYKYANQHQNQQQNGGGLGGNNRRIQNFQQKHHYNFSHQQTSFNTQKINPDYAFASLRWVNRYRHLHQAQSMSLDPDLMTRANNCALYYARRGVIDHSCGEKNGAGENLFMYRSLYSFSGRTDAALQAISSWYQEQKFYKNLYHRDPNGFSTAWGHFTALVWASSQKFGIGVATMGSRTVVVGLFYPHGNYLGRFQENVLPPLRS